MRNATIVRERESAEGVFGTLYLDDGWSCKTGELPWLDNENQVSCIPPGVYGADFLPRSGSGKFVNVYHVKPVPGRSGILIHAGNYVGARSAGFRSDSYGCILLGTRHGVLGTQDAVLASKKALREFVTHMEQDHLNLMIIKGY